ncbi:hypothetical protein OBBRIDRAFT_275742 [Obba rivulosa]|uniref:Uncharacterized protein n=1 Tax=Obba rivulosa TaxID=1052685 RepID=A0A8E2DPY1_9APHY|nr:hypothetical protein OBBRIDRAFT_275742 [Obba rivulosa]
MLQVAYSTLSSAAQSPKNWPWLPVELIDDIIAGAWSSPMATDERIKCFTSLCLVNHTVLRLFIRIALRDVHITTPRFADHYLRLLRERTRSEPDDDYFLPNASSAANALCRSLTFHVDAKNLDLPPESVHLFSARNPAAGAISSTLYMLDMLHLCPNLRRVTLAYTNWSFDDVFDHARLLLVPQQVENLEVRFGFSPGVSQKIAQDLRRRYVRRSRAYWTTPHVRHVAVFGAPIGFVSNLLEMCSNAETLGTDCTEHLDVLAQIPTNLHTLALHLPRSQLEKEAVENWRLCEALRAGLLSAAVDPQVVLFAGAQESDLREQVTQLCSSQTHLQHVLSA